jgi:glycosyltransferase involved in cell wall biosynthesis
MKKILFMVINMNVGGTEKALLNMINELPREEYDITILMLEEYGGFLEFIPDWVKIEYFHNYKNIKSILNNPPLITIINLLKKGRFIRAIIFLYFYLVYKLTKDRTSFFKYILREYPVIDKNYDLAVAYAGPMEFISYYVVYKIKSRKKVQWIHFDISQIGLNIKFATKIFNKFEQIFAVSEQGKNKLLSLIPNLSNKTKVFTNIVSSNYIVKMAEEGRGFQDDFRGVRILTVGRLSKEKGQDLTIPVLAKLKGEGYNVRWYCIGEGTARSEYEELINKHGIVEDFILMGSHLNPYPYMKQCDIYVQPSRHEGYCITLAEARCFSNPIVSTSFAGAREQLINEKTGLIVNCSADDIYMAVKRLLDDGSISCYIRENLQNEFVDNTKDIEKLFTIID